MALATGPPPSSTVWRSSPCKGRSPSMLPTMWYGASPLGPVPVKRSTLGWGAAGMIAKDRVKV